MKLKFYGATWCNDCRRSKQYFDEHNVEYEYIDIERVPGAAEEVERINKGLQSIPTTLFPDGEILVEPTNDQLQKALEKNKNLLISHKGGGKNGYKCKMPNVRRTMQLPATAG